MNNPTLSVVIPTFNRSVSLAVTLAGLGRQSYPVELYEVIVVSDGSTDDTAAIVDWYRTTAKNVVKFIQQTNAGPSAARNNGINAAANDVIVFVDDDVEPVPEFLERHAAWHAGDKRYAVIGPMSPDSVRSAQEPSWIAWEHDKLQRVYRMFQPGGPYPDGGGGPMHFYSGNASVYRRWLVELNGFDPRYTRQEDVELAERLSQNFGIRFFFDFGADGIHRPVRSFESWLKIPADYGRLDAQRLAEGTIDYERIRHNFENRHALSKAVIGAASAGPLAAQLTLTTLKNAARTASMLKLNRLAQPLLSGLYHAAYHQAYRKECLARKQSLAGLRGSGHVRSL